MFVGELREFFESGVSVLVGTRDRLLVPEGARGSASQNVQPSRRPSHHARGVPGS